MEKKLQLTDQITALVARIKTSSLDNKIRGRVERALLLAPNRNKQTIQHIIAGGTPGLIRMNNVKKETAQAIDTLIQENVVDKNGDAASLDMSLSHIMKMENFLVDALSREFFHQVTTTNHYLDWKRRATDEKIRSVDSLKTAKASFIEKGITTLSNNPQYGNQTEKKITSLVQKSFDQYVSDLEVAIKARY